MSGSLWRCNSLYEVFVSVGENGSGHTQVDGPSGEKSVYRYHPTFQLRSIETYLNGAVYRTHRYRWGSEEELAILCN